jgi:predicted tellurium resistance membrane protein TerC
MDLFTLDNFFTLIMLILLQAVLGFDNLLYVSLESKRAPANKHAYVRKLGIGLAIFLRIALLLVLTRLIGYFQDPVWSPNTGFLEASFNIHSLIVLLGGAFIIYTATKEIFHMISLEEGGHHQKKKEPASVGKIIFWIVLINLVFSFDSILSAMALTKEFAVMAAAIVTGGILMIWMADRVSSFLQKNRMYEVLGLFILFIVGIMLLTEGGHIAHLKFFGNAVMPMTKTTFYFVLVVLVLTDIAQSRYQRKLLAEKALLHRDSGHN